MQRAIASTTDGQYSAFLAHSNSTSLRHCCLQQTQRLMVVPLVSNSLWLFGVHCEMPRYWDKASQRPLERREAQRRATASTFPHMKTKSQKQNEIEYFVLGEVIME